MNTLKTLEVLVESWASDLSQSYIDQLPASFPNRTKIVNDGVWGITNLAPVELAVLNSPFLQRLRRVKQLGIVQFVYPTAEYSRFVHSLGVLNRVNASIEALLVREIEQRDRLRTWLPMARLGGLVHDVGHTFLSHVTEPNDQDSLPIVDGDVKQLCRDFQDEYDADGRVDVAEILSFLIIRSKPFRDILDIAASKNFQLAPEGISTSDAVDILSGTVVRSARFLDDHDCMWMSDLINGPLDADKQDYIRRDAEAAGIAVPFEPERLTSSLALIEIDRWYDRKKKRDRGPRTTIGLSLSGCSTADEIIQSRMLLQIKLYFHQKSRIYERLSARAWKLIHSNFETIFERKMSIGDLFEMSSELLFDGKLRLQVVRLCESETATPELKADLRILNQILIWLSHRPAPRRTFAYGRQFPNIDDAINNRTNSGVAEASQFGSSDNSSNDAWQRASKQIIENGDQIAKEIVDLALAAYEILKDRIDFDAAKVQVMLEAGTVVDMPPAKKMHIQSGMYVYSENSTNRENFKYSDVFKADHWADAFRDSRQLCGVYAAPGLEELVHLAAEVVFYRDFGAISKRMRTEHAKCDMKRLHEMKQELVSAGFYDAHIGGHCEILQYPYWTSDEDEATYQEHTENIRRNFETIEREKSQALQCFSTSCDLRVLRIDLIDSTSYFNMTDREGHESVLQELAKFVSLTDRLRTLPIRPLKGEGDAVFFVMSQDKSNEILEVLAQSISEGEWLVHAGKEIGHLVPEKEVPNFRIGVSEIIKDVTLNSFDVVGKEVTRLYRLEGLGKLEEEKPSILLVGNAIPLGDVLMREYDWIVHSQGEKSDLKGIGEPVRYCVLARDA